MNIILMNDRSRFANAQNYQIGDYVLANDWEIIDRIGPTFDCVVVDAKGKALAIDYGKREVRKSYQVNGDLWKEVVRRARERYNPQYGWYYGIELLLYHGDALATYFACTDSTRQTVKDAYIFFGQMVTFSSEMRKPFETASYKYFVPKLLPARGEINYERIKELIALC